MDTRPQLTKAISIKDFIDFYWLKSELVEFCKSENLPVSGGKIEVATRIAEYLRTGKIVSKAKKDKRAISNFDWSQGPLTLDTEITDNYRNTQLVRAFFLEHVGSQFKFSVKLMNWMKANQGKNLTDAITAYHQLKKEYQETKVKDIAPQFEYNTYLRDCLFANPKLSRNEAIAMWKVKRSKRGHNRYETEDINYLINPDT